MGILKKFKDWFKVATEHYEENSPAVQKVKEIQEKYGSVNCDYCGREIYSYEKRKTIAGKKHHIKCLRKLRKEARRQAF